MAGPAPRKKQRARRLDTRKPVPVPCPEPLYASVPAAPARGRVAWVTTLPGARKLAYLLGLRPARTVHPPFVTDRPRAAPGPRGVFVKKEYWGLLTATRSALWLQHPWRDPSTGRLFRDIDAKGSGHVAFNLTVSNAGPRPPQQALDAETVYGLAHLDYVQRDARVAEHLHRRGVRVALPLAVIRLHAIPPKGELERLRRQGVVPAGYAPAILVRAFSCKTRLSDALHARTERERRAAIQDAMAAVARERALREPGFNPREFNENAYHRWLVQAVAESLARMHHSGYAHGALNRHNITLAGELADLAGARPLNALDTAKRRQRIGKDVWDAFYALKPLVEKTLALKEMARLFNEGYARGWPGQEDWVQVP